MLLSQIADAWLASGQALALMLDYDGTLAPIVDNPAEAFIPEETLLLLKSLSQNPKIHLAVVSGRSVEQLCCFLPDLLTEKILFCGLHGGQIYTPTMQQYLLQPDLKRYQSLLAHFQHQLFEVLTQKRLHDKGVLLEDKGYSLALHVRQADSLTKDQALAAFHLLYSASTELQDIFKLQAGKQVLELLPKGFDKGQCVRFLIEHWQADYPVFPCYAGDDLTDESAFKAVNLLGGLSVVVGKALNESAAMLSLPSLEALTEALQALSLTRF